MVNAVAAIVFPVLCLALAFAALDLSTFLNSQRSAGATTCGEAEAPLLDGEAEVVLPPLATLLVLFFAVALIYHNLTSRHFATVPVPVPVAGAGRNRRLSIPGLAIFMLCVSAGTLQLIVFGQGAGGGGGAGHGKQSHHALGLAALRAMPAAATVTFFCGIMLILAGAAHVRAGGIAAVAGDEPIQGLLRLLTKVAAAALVGLMAMAFALCGAE